MAGFKYESQVLTKNIPYVNISLQEKIGENKELTFFEVHITKE